MNTTSTSDVEVEKTPSFVSEKPPVEVHCLRCLLDEEKARQRPSTFLASAFDAPGSADVADPIEQKRAFAALREILQRLTDRGVR